MTSQTIYKYFIILLICISCKGNKPNIYENNREEISSKKLFDLIGIYKTESNKNKKCNITLAIFSVGSSYAYELKTADGNFFGNVILKPIEKKKYYHVTFEGIEWSEYEESTVSSVDKDGNQKENKYFNGVIYENAINFENYGNSINNYVKLKECEKKFVQLMKE